MCYSGRCIFENRMGDCTVFDTIKFHDKYGFSACTVGGLADSPEEEQFIKNNAAILDSVLRQYRADEEAEHEQWLNKLAGRRAVDGKIY